MLHNQTLDIMYVNCYICVMNIQERIGQNIKRLREMAGKTQAEYGKEFKMSRSRICDLEAGRFMPNAGIIIILAKYHNVKTDEILMR